MGSDGLEPRLCRVELSTVQVMLYMELIYFGQVAEALSFGLLAAGSSVSEAESMYPRSSYQKQEPSHQDERHMHLILLREALYMYYLRLSTKAPPSLDSAFDLCLGRSRGHQLRSFFQV